MLENLLKPEDCRKCKWCCVFDDSDLWEKPQVFEETVRFVKKHFKQVCFVEEDGIFYFDMPGVMEEGQKDVVYRCPMLRDGEGCVLGEARMLDCKIWPFRIMETFKGPAITVAWACGTVSRKSDVALKKELLDSGLAGIIFEAAVRRPVMVRPFAKGYRIILYEEDYLYGEK